MSSIENEPYDLGKAAQNLYKMIGDIAGITVEIQGNLLAIGVRNNAATATIFLQGAQLSHYQQRNQSSAIWLSEQSEYQQGKPLRGGIPVCWPWFGNLNKNPDIIRRQFSATELPAHGFARNKLWELRNIDNIDSETTIVTLQLNIDKRSYHDWSFPAKLLMRFTIASQLTVEFSVENTGVERFSYSTALHTYFPVHSIHDTHIVGLEQCNYHDCLDNWDLKTQIGPIHFTQETDRLYYFESETTEKHLFIHDKKHRIEVNSNYSKSCVVWNPWIDKSKTLSAYNDNDYLKMVCVETAQAGKNFITLEPGDIQELKLQINSTTMGS